MTSVRPLQGVTVIEIGHTIAAPYAGMILAELGADVIKVENPHAPDYTRDMPPFRDGISAVFQSMNRGKRAVAVDLADAAQASRLRRLVIERADVVLHNLKFGAMERLGLGAEALLEQQPRLIYCNLGAFGRRGPLREKPGYDPLMQAFSGLMSIMGEDGRPPVRVGVSITDMATGMWAVIGIQAALRERERTGAGGLVDTSLFDTAVGWMAVQFASFLASGEPPGREGSGVAMMVPYQAFATQDGYLMVAAGNDRMFRRLCEALQRPELAEDPRFRRNRDRCTHRAELIGILQEAFAGSPIDKWMARLDAHGVPNSRINDLGDVVAHPHARESGLFQTSPDGTMTLLGLPLCFDGERPPFRRNPPAPGEHDAEIFGPANGP